MRFQITICLNCCLNIFTLLKLDLSDKGTTPLLYETTSL